MKISTFNANSIRSRLPILIDWIKLNQPDVLGIQETKVQDQDFPKENFEKIGYHVVFRGEKSYNGIALISKKEPCDVKFGFDDGGPPDQTRLIRAKYDHLHIINTYIPQGRSIDHMMYKYKLNWYLRLKKLFEKEYNSALDIVWMGDMNIAVSPIDVTNPQTKKNDPCYHFEARKAFLKTCSFGFDDLLRIKNPNKEVYSFFDYRVKDAIQKNIGWRIDYILSTPSLTKHLVNCEIDYEPRRKEKPSDHTFMTATFKTG